MPNIATPLIEGLTGDICAPFFGPDRLLRFVAQERGEINLLDRTDALQTYVNVSRDVAISSHLGYQGICN